MTQSNTYELRGRLRLGMRIGFEDVNLILKKSEREDDSDSWFKEYKKFLSDRTWPLINDLESPSWGKSQKESRIAAHWRFHEGSGDQGT
jgi:hypothetical protein